MCESFSQTRFCPSQAKNIPACQKYSRMPKINPGELPVSSINSVHINIYICTQLIEETGRDTFDVIVTFLKL